MGGVEGQPQHLHQQQGGLRDGDAVGHEAEQDFLRGKQDSLGFRQDSQLTASKIMKLNNFRLKLGSSLLDCLSKAQEECPVCLRNSLDKFSQLPAARYS